jgi:hypothetical protein
MPRVKVKGFKDFQRLVGRKAKVSIKKAIRDKQLRRDIGDIVVDGIRKKKFRAPTEVTKIWRDYLVQFNSTHPDYDREKINITFTGGLLEDLASNVKSDTINLAIVIEQSDKKHKKLKTANGRAEDDAWTFKMISDNLINKLDLDYLTLDKAVRNDIVKLMQKRILELVVDELSI